MRSALRWPSTRWSYQAQVCISVLWTGLLGLCCQVLLGSILFIAVFGFLTYCVVAMQVNHNMQLHKLDGDNTICQHTHSSDATPQLSKLLVRMVFLDCSNALGACSHCAQLGACIAANSM